MGKGNKSVWKEFLESVQFCIDSKKGKYSLEMYLEIIGEYTDRLIIQAEETGMHYSGGECVVKRNAEREVYEFSIHVYFIDGEGETVEKKAFRKISVDRFTKETVSQIGTNEIKFNIEKPERRKNK